ncbi:prenyltransferase/squalene oxidase repeat-containing protein [Dactylosporangium sp. NPDC051484]|uniref:prenyltransferase/squalene oxidase repeat-containing protein n=1 Tax=Dactylosporangium sp. NPDC051484 TaxID=3154942 RepID=UPI00344E2A6D
MASPPPLRDFIARELVDDRGAVRAVVGRDGRDVITGDRQLLDAALAVLMLTGTPHDELLAAGLRDFADSEAAGWHELLDVTGAPQAAGLVRHPGVQALAEAAAIRGGDDDGPLRRVLERSSIARWPLLFDRAGEVVLDASRSLADLAQLVLAAAAAGVWPVGFAERAADGLRGFEVDGAVHALLDAAGRPDPTAGRTLRATVLGALAWMALTEQGNDAGTERARALLRQAETTFRGSGPGLWDRADATGTVRVDPVSAYHGRAGSPFPIKSIADHALVLRAAERLAEEAADVSLKELAADARAMLDRYADHAAGGLFEGQGSWFSTPVDPTVPLARHVLVAAHTPGAFAVGNTAYVPFHTKHATTQLLALWALGGREPVAPAVPGPVPALAPFPLERTLRPVTTAPLSPGLIDVPAYLRWLQGTRSGLGYGLTPYRAPLGLRSDRTAQTFSVIHVVSDLMALGEPVPDPDRLLAGLAATQNPDGGFGEQPGMPSEVFTTYCAILTAFILGAAVPGRARCTEFVQAAQHPDGSYGNAPGFPGDAWHSNLAVLTLLALGERPDREPDLLAFLAACQNPDGGYGEQPGAVSDSFATFRAVDTLVALGLRPPALERTVGWLRDLQGESGGFRYRAGAVESFVGTYHAIAALYVVGHGPRDREAAKYWVAARQSADGGFARVPGGPSDTTDEGFIAIQALHMLEGKLNPYWAVIMT